MKKLIFICFIFAAGLWLGYYTARIDHLAWCHEKFNQAFSEELAASDCKNLDIERMTEAKRREGKFDLLSDFIEHEENLPAFPWHFVKYLPVDFVWGKVRAEIDNL